MKLGQILGALAGVMSLVYVLLIGATAFARGFTVIEITGLFSITLWILVIIDIDKLIKDYQKRQLEYKDKHR